MSLGKEEIKTTVKDCKYRIAMIITAVVAIMLGTAAMSLPQMVTDVSYTTTIDHDFRANTTMVSHGTDTHSYAKDATAANILMAIGSIFVVFTAGFTVLAVDECNSRR